MATKSPRLSPDVDRDIQRPPTMPFEERLQKVVDKALYSGSSPIAQKVRNFFNGM
jgi:hypothetical protein